MARLMEQEQQEVIRFVKAGKTLPEKYRFLLFDDKREVELVWNGKTNEVTNVVLPFQVIEQVDVHPCYQHINAKRRRPPYQNGEGQMRLVKEARELSQSLVQKTKNKSTYATLGRV
jgi:hypothetical protein